ncbi:MAG: hypothetical protein HQM15_06610 [Deltaproteobacteria bacterium]|nr:hypothetical protein [Deltaproteobacteria bacterium]
MNECLQYQNELVTLLYEDEGLKPDLKNHLKDCAPCQLELENLKQTQSFFSLKQDVFPPAQLEQKIFEQIAQKNKSNWSFFRLFLLHPATVAVSVFLLTLGGTLTLKKNYLAPQQIARQELVSAPVIQGAQKSIVSSELEAPDLDSNFAKVSYRMLDWNPLPRLTPDLDRPVLKYTSLGSLEQSSLEAVSTFQHQIAMRHILDGDYQQASQALLQVIDRDERYSQWEQAMMLHLLLMKRMGQQQEIQRDLNRLKAYAYARPELLQKAEEILR